MEEFNAQEVRPLPREALVPMLVEGNAEGDLVYVEPGDVTLFDFVASYRTSFEEAPALRRRPAIVSSASYDPDKNPEAYYYAKLLLHFPWSQFDVETGPTLLLPEDKDSYKKAFERLCPQTPRETKKAVEVPVELDSATDPKAVLKAWERVPSSKQCSTSAS